LKQETLAANQPFATKNPAWVSPIRNMRNNTASRRTETMFSLTGPHRQLRNKRPPAR
jgi:hypothetical protein